MSFFVFKCSSQVSGGKVGIGKGFLTIDPILEQILEECVAIYSIWNLCWDGPFLKHSPRVQLPPFVQDFEHNLNCFFDSTNSGKK